MKPLYKSLLITAAAVSIFIAVGRFARGEEFSGTGDLIGTRMAVQLAAPVAQHVTKARKHRLTDSNGNRVPRFKCGYVQRRHFNLPPEFNLALRWARLPRTTPQPGAVVVQRRKGRALGGGPGGHVSRIVSLTGSCRAIVADEKGQYERDICKALVAYVDPRAINQ